ncbi:unnamed protein product [Sphagnum troendelagicum]|uniref:Uncharacterized protein n=1 Tax=Sphagnum troendelagicum TaxID=128251 RepID=A0ABP0ULH3_9BRYO
MHPRIVQALKLKLQTLPEPIQVLNPDGTPFSELTLQETEPLIMKIGTHVEQATFRILPSKHDVVLPLKWFETHDPDILWREHQVHFTSKTCRKHCLVAEQDAVRLCPETFEPLETPEHSEHPEHLDAEHVHGDTTVSSPSQHPRSIGPANPSDLEENATSTGNEQLTSDAEPANNSTESRTTSRPGRQETLLPEILNPEFMKLLDNPDLPDRIAY